MSHHHPTKWPKKTRDTRYFTMCARVFQLFQIQKIAPTLCLFVQNVFSKLSLSNTFFVQSLKDDMKWMNESQIHNIHKLLNIKQTRKRKKLLRNVFSIYFLENNKTNIRRGRWLTHRLPLYNQWTNKFDNKAHKQKHISRAIKFKFISTVFPSNRCSNHRQNVFFNKKNWIFGKTFFFF